MPKSTPTPPRAIIYSYPHRWGRDVQQRRTIDWCVENGAEVHVIAEDEYGRRDRWRDAVAAIRAGTAHVIVVLRREVLPQPVTRAVAEVSQAGGRVQVVES